MFFLNKVLWKIPRPSWYILRLRSIKFTNKTWWTGNIAFIRFLCLSLYICTSYCLVLFHNILMTRLCTYTSRRCIIVLRSNLKNCLSFLLMYLCIIFCVSFLKHLFVFIAIKIMLQCWLLHPYFRHFYLLCLLVVLKHRCKYNGIQCNC